MQIKFPSTKFRKVIQNITEGEMFDNFCTNFLALWLTNEYKINKQIETKRSFAHYQTSNWHKYRNPSKNHGHFFDHNNRFNLIRNFISIFARSYANCILYRQQFSAFNVIVTSHGAISTGETLPIVALAIGIGNCDHQSHSIYGCVINTLKELCRNSFQDGCKTLN